MDGRGVKTKLGKVKGEGKSLHMRGREMEGGGGEGEMAEILPGLSKFVF